MGEAGSEDIVVPEFEERLSISKGDIYRALVEAKGNIAKASRALSIRRGALKLRIDAIPECVALLEDLREAVVDASEENIFADVEKGDQSASRFVAQTLGKARGWSMGVSGLGKDGAITVEIREFAKPEKAA